ncbi:MAG TPA: hypothetical protein VIV58_01620 [Kofleriaceae bacterium]
MKPGPWGVLVCAALVGTAHGQGPKLEGRLGLGVRTSSTSESHYSEVFDDTSSVRLAAAALVGVRLGPVVVGVHGGVATPLKFDSVEYFGEAEVLPGTTSTIYPLDLGLGAELDTHHGLSFSGWIGATFAFAHAKSPAVFLNNIDSYGQVPAVAWRYSTTSLGFGAAVGYDLVRNEYGRVAGVLGIDVQGIGAVPLRNNMGAIGRDSTALTTTSLTLGVAYSY